MFDEAGSGCGRNCGSKQVKPFPSQSQVGVSAIDATSQHCPIKEPIHSQQADPEPLHLVVVLVGGLTLGRAHVEGPTARLLSNTMYTSAKLDYQSTGVRFVAPPLPKLLNRKRQWTILNLRPGRESSPHRDTRFGTLNASVSNGNTPDNELFRSFLVELPFSRRGRAWDGS